MVHTGGNEQAKTETHTDTKPRNIFPNILRNRTAWITTGVVGLVGIVMGSLINDGLEVHDRSTDIKVAARAWAHGTPNAFKGLSKVLVLQTQSEKQSGDNAPLTITRTIINSDFATRKDQVAFLCATAVLSNDAKTVLFTPGEVATIADGLEANAPVASTDSALKICSAEVEGKTTLVFPVGGRGKAATIAWLNESWGSPKITQLP